MLHLALVWMSGPFSLVSALAGLRYLTLFCASSGSFLARGLWLASSLPVGPAAHFIVIFLVLFLLPQLSFSSFFFTQIHTSGFTVFQTSCSAGTHSFSVVCARASSTIFHHALKTSLAEFFSILFPQNLINVAFTSIHSLQLPCHGSFLLQTL